jgi:hypothetical protein
VCVEFAAIETLLYSKSKQPLSLPGHWEIAEEKVYKVGLCCEGLALK